MESQISNIIQQINKVYMCNNRAKGLIFIGLNPINSFINSFVSQLGKIQLKYFLKSFPSMVIIIYKSNIVLQFSLEDWF
jgi:hypothetical protein